MNKVTKNTVNKNYQEVRSESYRILEERAGCDLNTRQRNLKQRLEESGATKSKINSVTKMDVIESDKRLKEIYTGIVKEMVIKYVA
jgi:DNA-binding transcriptional regulator YhcF (GntR family)